MIQHHPDRVVVQATVADAGHFTPEMIEQQMRSYPKRELESRMKGIPQFGSGVVFPVEESFITCAAFEIPDHWVQIAGLDFGWDHPSAAAKTAWDRDNDVFYVTACHRARENTPIMFAGAVKPWGDWLKWAWPHDGLQHDKGSGIQLAQQYKAQGLAMLPEKATFPDGSNGVEAGIAEMLGRMETGRFKVFAHLAQWFEEFRLYHRDEDGLIVKKVDDLISATRYAMMMRRFATVRLKKQAKPLEYHGSGTGNGWMG